MEKYADFILIFVGLLWFGIYWLLDIPFESIITGIILGIFLIISILLYIFCKDKKSNDE